MLNAPLLPCAFAAPSSEAMIPRVPFMAWTLGALLAGSAAAQDRTATVSEAKGQVMRGEGKPPAPETTAAAGARIQTKDYVRTGTASLAELTMPADALTRLGPTSVFRFAPDSTNFILERGEGMFVFPKGQGGANISTPSLAAGILGTTIYVRVNRDEILYACLEGRCRIGPHLLEPGEMLVLRGGRQAYAAPKLRFRIGRLLQENPLARSFATPLPSQALIEAEARLQR